ncbi:hypothetical protein EHI8A_217720 [Entamoeba histolytica HM-1:IMSS-B]|uniref:Uncharacterized protein n=6 Tax=Entamoeba histolytica TaxID=5759 RepID=C4LWN9_ENTH1|nr:hypothetical protein EHI_069510 [Entamoeba histolytica HM-1:IMSS]EMD45229.1 Hypothetical protein EHI5A_187820 [Entamoeba histolytica KU27]EMH78129.1 hypothetical protein EHI8A_217720 [Entamoeba histolytica HM-1:IMSS-B]EMS17784.1 hypothetical protein KM1_218980 [Entamoeba histolytica HM-3:IMSS]ENY62868.1 hypothetical protein EHI7A_134660 [Entamoeba histolytica HM-1:IMSS-A]GAT93128.1 hypothetical protein CL6EHI_069510 [Entamoeba histolytica]|eukprot:XP_650886.1 hypothetical protein EHI_069510 [Entamoeba histolytica HM-1:IMSS]
MKAVLFILIIYCVIAETITFNKYNNSTSDKHCSQELLISSTTINIGKCYTFSKVFGVEKILEIYPYFIVNEIKNTNNEITGYCIKYSVSSECAIESEENQIGLVNECHNYKSINDYDYDYEIKSGSVNDETNTSVPLYILMVLSFMLLI